MKEAGCRALVKLFVAQCCFAWPLYAQNLDSLVGRSLEFARQQLIRTVAELRDTTVYGDQIYPRSTQPDGRWRPKAAGHWASGFLPGCLWYMHQWTSDDVWREWAENWTAGLESQKYRTQDHEAGFIIYRSFGLGYNQTGSEPHKAVLLQAVRSLVTRYNPAVGCIRSWNNRTFPVIIDGMMVLELLFWASKNGGDAKWYDMAVTHSLQTMQNNVRPDGSHYQIVDYNPSTGAVLTRTNKQGYADSTTWARGQAWGLYGFAMTYRETGDPRFLETARKMADYFIDNLPADHVPFWDFAAPNIPDEEKDVSAAAIAASGLLELSTLVSDSEEKERYGNAAFGILASLCSPAYLAAGTNSRGILLHGVGNRMNPDREAGEVDVSLIYADHFFIEALLRYKAMAEPVAIKNRPLAFPSSIQLLQNHPNPFNSQTTISYELVENAYVELTISDLLGGKVQTITNRLQSRGKHSTIWDGKNESGRRVASGVYHYRLKVNDSVLTKRMILIN